MMWIEIMRVSDGATRRYHDPSAWEDYSEYMWSDGNYSCDCNRSLFFARATGGEVGLEESEDCGNASYRVRITDDNGSRLYADADWPERWR